MQHFLSGQMFHGCVKLSREQNTTPKPVKGHEHPSFERTHGEIAIKTEIDSQLPHFELQLTCGQKCKDNNPSTQNCAFELKF
jgi:hypothetical protein